MCQNCDALEIEIDNLTRDLEEAEQALERVRQFAQAVIAKSDGILGQRSGVPRGRWAFAKGAKEIAARVLALAGV